MMVRFEEDEYIAVAIFDAGDRIQTMNAMDEIFSYLDEDMKYLIFTTCLLYTSPSPRDGLLSRMPSSA